MNEVLVIGGSVQLIKILNEKGLNYSVLLSLEDDYQSKYLKKALSVHVIDYSDYKKSLEFIRMLHERYSFQGIICFVEKDLLFSSRVAEDLGFKFISTKASLLTSNKLRLREYLSQKNNLKVFYQKINSKDQLVSVLKKVDFDLIVKPFEEEGSRNVYRLRSVDDLNIISEHLEFPLLAEEFLEGDEYSVETLSSDGDHKVIGITKKIKDEHTFIEYGHIFPAKIEGPIRKRILSTVVNLLDTIKMNDGPSHIEIIVTEKGPKIVEAHARLGGDKIPELIKLSTGVDIEKAVIDQFMNIKEFDVESYKISYFQVAAIRFFDLPEGYIKEINNVEKAKNIKNVRELIIDIDEGTYVKKDTDSFTRKGYAVIVGKSEEEIEETWEKLTNTIEFRYQGKVTK